MGTEIEKSNVMSMLLIGPQDGLNLDNDDDDDKKDITKDPNFVQKKATCLAGIIIFTMLEFIIFNTILGFQITTARDMYYDKIDQVKLLGEEEEQNIRKSKMEVRQKADSVKMQLELIRGMLDKAKNSDSFRTSMRNQFAINWEWL